MNKYYSLLVFLTFWLSLVCSETNLGDGVLSAAVPLTDNRQNTLLADLESALNSDDNEGSNLDKRVERYAFGLGRRAYTYTAGGNEIKRLPVYNFGLGKRARPYSFGLGKRAEYNDELYDADLDRKLYEAYSSLYNDEKRYQPYSFGLGKRDSLRGPPPRDIPSRYGFGIGRR